MLRETLISLAILALTWLAAHLVSFLLGRVLHRAAAATSVSLDDQLVAALRGPLHNALLLFGAYVAVHRLPIHDRWTARADQALFALTVFVVAIGAIRAYTILLRWYSTETTLGAESPLAREFGPLLSKLGKVVIVLLALITVLQHFSVDVNSLVVSLGVGSLAVGLAAQDTLANMFAGFALMLDRPFKLGDRIQLVSGEVGDVVAIGIRATRIRTLDDTILVIPNAALVKERVVNQSQPGREIATRSEIAVAWGSDPAVVKRVLSEAALASPRVDPSRPPAAVLARLADGALVFRLAFFARDYAEQGLALSEVLEEALRRLAEARVELAQPQRVLAKEGKA